MSITLSSSLPQRTFAARLKRSIADSFRLRKQPITFTWKKPVAGEVWVWSDGTIRFFIFKRRFALNSLAPRLTGIISSSENGSTMTAKVDVRHILFDIVFFPGLVIFAILSPFYVFMQRTFQEYTVLFEVAGIILLVGLWIGSLFDLRFLERFLAEFVKELSRNDSVSQ